MSKSHYLSEEEKWDYKSKSKLSIAISWAPVEETSGASAFTRRMVKIKIGDRKRQRGWRNWDWTEAGERKGYK